MNLFTTDTLSKLGKGRVIALTISWENTPEEITEISDGVTAHRPSGVGHFLMEIEEDKKYQVVNCVYDLTGFGEPLTSRQVDGTESEARTIFESY